MTKRNNPALAVCVWLMLTGGCDSKEGDSRKETKDTIAVIPKGSTHLFWKSIHAGAVKAAEELGVEVVWKGPLKEDDRESQITVVENAVNMQVDGIVLAPLDDAALRVPVETAVRNKIPVVIIDSELKSDKHVSFVATDNYKGGQLAGEEMARLLSSKGKVALLRFVEGSASTMKREQGFLDAIAKHSGIEVVSSNQYGGGTTATAITASENLLQRFKTDQGLSLDGIFCPNESTASGMLITLKAANLAGKIKLIGFDSSEMLIRALKEGHVQATVMQDPIRMGYLGVKTLVKHLRGNKVAAHIDTGASLITATNMNRPEVSQLIRPDYKRWLKE